MHGWIYFQYDRYNTLFSIYKKKINHYTAKSPNENNNFVIVKCAMQINQNKTLKIGGTTQQK